MVKDFFNTYTVSGIMFIFLEGELNVLLVRNNDGTIGFPGGKEGKEDGGLIVKTFERELQEEVTDVSELLSCKKTFFYEIIKKRDDDQKKEMVHHFLRSEIEKNEPLFKNTKKEFFVSWKEVFFLDNLRPTVIAGMTAFILNLKKEAAHRSSLQKSWNSVYQKNDDLHLFCQAFEFPNDKGHIAIKNYLAVDILQMSDILSKPS